MERSAGRTDDVVVPGPYVDVDSVEDGKEREPPADAINDDLLSALEELIDDGAEEKEVDEGPWRALGLGRNKERAG